MLSLDAHRNSINKKGFKPNIIYQGLQVVSRIIELCAFKIKPYLQTMSIKFFLLICLIQNPISV